jgi:2-haloalkanoic acid dehalogenase type II
MNPRPVRLRDVQALTFDCYGTLIDWEGGARQTVRRQLARKGLAIDEDAFFQAWEQEQRARIQQSYAPYREIAAETFLAVARAQGLPLDGQDAREFAHSIPTWTPFPDVRGGLARLKGKLRLGIISNIDDDILANSVQALGVEFDLLLTAEQARAYKPSPLPFRLALQRLGLPADLVAHAAFGFEYDLVTAAQLGFRTILVRRLRRSFPPTPVPDLVVADVEELAAQFE